MVGILDLPAEMLDHIFGYLELHDQKHAQLVCHQWNDQFSMPRYSKMRSLQLNPRELTNETLGAVLRAAKKGKYHCIAIFYRIPINRTNEVVQLLEACRFSLEEIRLIDCNQSTLRSVYKTLGKMCRLRHLILESVARVARLPKVPRPDSEAAGFTSVTHLEVSLTNDSYLKLVHSLAPQLTSLILGVLEGKKLLVQCLNEPRLTALHSLTVNADSCFEVIHQDELGDACRRMLAQLESFQYTGYRICYVMTEIIRNCHNLKRLAIFHCSVSVNCIKLICELKGLKYLNLNLYGMFDDTHPDPPPLIELPNLEELYLSPEIGLRMGKRWPKLTSIGFNKASSIASLKAKGILSDITKIDGISERRLRKFLLKAVCLDRAAIEWIRTLAVDKLTFEECRIDGSVFDVLLARPKTQAKFLTIVMQQCKIIFASDAVYNVRTFDELVTQCPHLRIAHSEITFASRDESPLF